MDGSLCPSWNHTVQWAGGWSESAVEAAWGAQGGPGLRGAFPEVPQGLLEGSAARNKRQPGLSRPGSGEGAAGVGKLCCFLPKLVHASVSPSTLRREGLAPGRRTHPLFPTVPCPGPSEKLGLRELGPAPSVEQGAGPGLPSRGPPEPRVPGPRERLAGEARRRALGSVTVTAAHDAPPPSASQCPRL